MRPEIIPFAEAFAEHGELTNEERPNNGSKFTERKTLPAVNVEESRTEAPTDRELAQRVTRAIGELQGVLDAAILAGLMVEPSFKRVDGRFNEFGVSVESHVCHVQIYRKLA